MDIGCGCNVGVAVMWTGRRQWWWWWCFSLKSVELGHNKKLNISMDSRSLSRSRSRSRSRSPTDRKMRTDRFSYRDAPYRRDGGRRGGGFRFTSF